MSKTSRASRHTSSMGRRDFLRAVGATAVGTGGLLGLMDPFRLARAAIPPD